MISLAGIVAGAPFFFGDGEADGVGLGVPLASGVALGDGEVPGDSVGEGVGVAEDLRLFFLGEALGEDTGDGVGETFFFFVEGDELGSVFSAGVGLAAGFFLGDGDFSGEAVGFGEGDCSAVAFFFGCLRGVGVGVGAKIFLSLLPNDSSAGAVAATLAIIATTQIARVALRVRRMERESSTAPFDEEQTKMLSSRAAQTARDLTIAYLPPCEKTTPLKAMAWFRRKLIDICKCEVPRRLRGSG